MALAGALQPGRFYVLVGAETGVARLPVPCTFVTILAVARLSIP
jgi:hypothetical protein